MLHTPPSRRRLLQCALAAVAPLVWPPLQAQSLSAPAYQVTPWSGPVPALVLTDTTGQVWRTENLAGRAVLLNFWASWCEPCRAEMPSLQQLAHAHGPATLLVLAINFKEAPARALQFVQATGVTLPVLLDTDGKLAKESGVRVFPSTLTIDRRGRPRHRVQGEVDWGDNAAQKLVASLLDA